VTGEVRAILAGRVKALHPSRRLVTVALRPVGRGRSFSSAYSGAAPGQQLAPVVDLRTRRHVGRVTRIDPVAGGAELSLIVGDDEAWQALTASHAKVDVQCAFESSSSGDPVNGRPVRVKIG
jgi:hypothetical protein